MYEDINFVNKERKPSFALREYDKIFNHCFDATK